mgnify:CR=1 FL=1
MMPDSIIGYLVKSRAGHDAGRYYLVLDQDDIWLNLVDGRYRCRDNGKRKRVKHVDVLGALAEETDLRKIKTAHPESGLADKIIRELIKQGKDTYAERRFN